MSDDDCTSNHIRYLATIPASILGQWNENVYDGYDFIRHTPRCILVPDNGRIEIPNIPSRCLTRWQLGPELARGTRAVVFRTRDTGDQYIIRIVPITSDRDRRLFRRDVEARLVATCLTRDRTESRTATGMRIGIDHVVDAFFCTRDSVQYGITVAERYDMPAIEHFIALETASDRMWFMARFKWSLDVLLQTIHEVGIAHRDVHHGNILYREVDDKIVLTDFDMAIGRQFDDQERVLNAYISNESSRVVVEELQAIHQYLTHGDDSGLVWDDLWYDYGITKNKLKTRWKTTDAQRPTAIMPEALSIERKTI